MRLKIRLISGIVLMKNGLIFIGLKKRKSHEYCAMPQGGIEPHEEPQAASVRELFEETGVLVDPEDCIRKSEIYDVELPKEYQQNFHIQRYQWFLYNFPAAGNIKLCEKEFFEYKWATASEVLEHADFKIEMLRSVFKEFDLI
jgi:putative (di)nucleoside polyphosphate hydrolase